VQKIRKITNGHENRHRLSRWGIHEAFTCGVLNRILKAKEDEGGIGDMRPPRRFEIYGLSGTSEAIEQAPELRMCKVGV
jgi:hypothetical protein